MSQVLTDDVVRNLREGDTLYSNVIEFVDEDGGTYPGTATVLGPASFDNRIERWILPVRREYGNFVPGHIGGRGGWDLWRTVPEKVVQPRQSRVRPRPVAGTETDGEAAPSHAGRIRRHREVAGAAHDAAREPVHVERRRRVRPA